MADDKISEVLDLEFEDEPVANLPVRVDDTVTQVNEEPVTRPDPHDHVDEDFEEARETIDEILETGMDALKELVVVAKASQQARAFEVLSTMMKTLTDTAQAKIDVAEKRNKVKGVKASTTSGGGGKTINAVFVGSTAQLQKYLDGQKGAKTHPDVDEDAED